MKKYHHCVKFTYPLSFQTRIPKVDQHTGGNIIKFFLRYIYVLRDLWPWRCVGLCDIVILSWLVSIVSIVYFNCIIQTCKFVSGTPSESIGLFLLCVLFWCWVSLCVLFTNSLKECYFIMVVAMTFWILGPFYKFWSTHLGLLELGSSGSATTHFHGCFCPGHSLWKLDWTCFLRTPLCYI